MSDVGRIEHGCRSLEAVHADCCDYEKRVLTFQAQWNYRCGRLSCGGVCLHWKQKSIGGTRRLSCEMLHLSARIATLKYCPLIALRRLRCVPEIDLYQLVSGHLCRELVFFHVTFRLQPSYARDALHHSI
jgi:hypothetical protein